MLSCWVIEVKTAEDGWRITTNFKMHFFTRSVNISHAEGKIVEWKLKSTSSAESSSS
jgi:hypothetical protein